MGLLVVCRIYGHIMHAYVARLVLAD